MARLRQGNGASLGNGSSALTCAVVFLVVDLFLGLSVGALGFTQALIGLPPASSPNMCTGPYFYRFLQVPGLGNLLRCKMVLDNVARSPHLTPPLESLNCILECSPL